MLTIRDKFVVADFYKAGQHWLEVPTWARRKSAHCIYDGEGIRPRPGTMDACLSAAAGPPMNWHWILLGIVAWVLGALFVLILMRMAGDQDRDARRAQHDLDPFADVTVTRPGE